jgi:urocanate hydratase
VRDQYKDNLKWIREAHSYNLVVGSKARILYSDQQLRVSISLALNNLVREKKLKGPIVISRDHHDVSGTDSPYRETSNIYDGSAFTADMAVQNFIGDGIRGATWVALHNGGGVGWGEGLRIKTMLILFEIIERFFFNFNCIYSN